MSIHNYGKRINQQGISRHHNRFRYDENYQLKTSALLINAHKNSEKARFEETFKQFQKIYDQQYFQPSSKRKDTRSEELPEKYDNYLYFTRHAFMENNDYELIYRKNLQSGQEELVLDLKDVPWIKKKQQATARLTKMALSDDHNYIAFGVDLLSNEKVTFGFKNIKNNVYYRELLDNCINVKFHSLNNSVIYVKHDEKHWSNQVFYHQIGTNLSADKLIYEEKDDQFFIDIGVTKDRQYSIINCASRQSTEILVLPRIIKNNNEQQHNLKVDKEQIIGKKTLEQKLKSVANKNTVQSSNEFKLNCIFSRKKKCRGFANHTEGKFYILTDQDDSYDFKIVTLSDLDYFNNDFSKLQDFYHPKVGEVITEIDIFKDDLVLYIKKDGISYITVINHTSKQAYNIQLPEKVALINPGLNENYLTSTFRFHVDTPFIYNRVYEYNLSTKKLVMLQDFIMSGPSFNAKNYTCTQLQAPGVDGEMIPITLVHSNKLKKNRKNKFILFGYGSYSLPLEPEFNIVYLSALENGWGLAYAHVRGGNEKGWAWYKAALKEKKVITMKDFISCAEFLIEQGYTHPSLLCAYGSSAGGMLVGAVANMRPELFKAIVLNVPFLDVLTALLDEQLALSAPDYEELGNPLKDQQIYDVIASYSPYENIQLNIEYPAVFISCGQQDFRSPLWNVLKYVKRFRERVKKPLRVEEFCDKNLLVHIQDSGHQGLASIESGISDKAIYLAFLDYVVTKKNKDITIKNNYQELQEKEDLRIKEELEIEKKKTTI